MASVLGLIALAIGATTGAAATPVPLSSAVAAAAEVQVFAYCNADGSYSFNAVGHGFAARSKQTIYSVSTSNYYGGGSSRYTEGHGNLYASSSGFITTPTYYSEADSRRETIAVKVVIGGVSGTDSANCD